MTDTPVPPKKKGFFHKIGSALGAVASAVVNVLMAGKGGAD